MDASFLESRKPVPELVGAALKVAKVQDTDSRAKAMWALFNDKYGSGKELKDQSDDILESFLEWYSEARTSDATMQELNKIRATPEVNAQWLQYNEQIGIGLTNVLLMPNSFVREFIAKHRKGSLPLVEMVTGDMVNELNGIFKKNKRIKQQWVSYTEAEGQGTWNPKLHSKRFVERFLESIRDKISIATLQDLDMLRRDPQADCQWEEYKTNNYDAKVRNHRDLPESFVRGFLTAHAQGSLPEVEMPTEKMIEDLYDLLKSEGSIETHWRRYVKQTRAGTIDAKRHSAASVQWFLSCYQA